MLNTFDYDIHIFFIKAQQNLRFIKLMSRKINDKNNLDLRKNR